MVRSGKSTKYWSLILLCSALFSCTISFIKHLGGIFVTNLPMKGDFIEVTDYYEFSESGCLKCLRYSE